MKAYLHQKREFSPNTSPRVRERIFEPQDGLQNAPRSAQDDSKSLLKSNFFALENCLKFWLVLGRILVYFGSSLGGPKTNAVGAISVLKLVFFTIIFSYCFGSAPRRPKRRPGGPKTPPRAPQEAPRGRQERPRKLPQGRRRPQEPLKRAQDPPRSFQNTLKEHCPQHNCAYQC